MLRCRHLTALRAGSRTSWQLYTGCPPLSSYFSDLFVFPSQLHSFPDDDLAYDETAYFLRLTRTPTHSAA